MKKIVILLFTLFGLSLPLLGDGAAATPVKPPDAGPVIKEVKTATPAPDIIKVPVAKGPGKKAVLAGADKKAAKKTAVSAKLYERSAGELKAGQTAKATVTSNEAKAAATKEVLDDEKALEAEENAQLVSEKAAEQGSKIGKKMKEKQEVKKEIVATETETVKDMEK